MDDCLGVRRNQSVRNLHTDLENLLGFEGLASNALLQAFPFQPFHDDKGMAIVILNVVDRADVGVVQLRGGARFAAKTL